MTAMKQKTRPLLQESYRATMVSGNDKIRENEHALRLALGPRIISRNTISLSRLVDNTLPSTSKSTLCVRVCVCDYGTRRYARVKEDTGAHGGYVTGDCSGPRNAIC